MRRRPWWPVVPALALVLLAGCSSSSNASADKTTTSAPGVDLPAGAKFQDLTGRSRVVVKAVDNNFDAPFIKVSPGTTVEFQNAGRNRHDVVPDEDGSFQEIPTDQFDPGYSKTITFTKPGVYGYYCSLHGTPTKGMYGAVEVVG